MAIKFKDSPNGAPQLFWKALTSTSNNLGLSQLWAVSISQADLSDISTSVFQLGDYDHFDWSTNRNAKAIHHSNWFIGGEYCLMAQGATFPGDGLNISRIGSKQTGAINGLIGENRQDLQEVTISFLETNYSITDLLFRPWSILAGYRSLKDSSLRKDIKLTFFQKTGTNSPLRIRKQFVLEGAVPVSIDNKEYNYSADRVVTRQVKFAYSRYYVVDAGWEKVGGQSDAEAYIDIAKEPLPALTQPPITIDPALKPKNEIDDLTGDTSLTDNLLPDHGMPKPLKIYGTEKPGGILGLFDSITNLGDTLVGSVDTLYTNVKGKSDRVQSSTTRMLRLIGQDDTADRVDKVFNQAHDDVGKPVADIVNTGNDYVNASRSARSLTREVVDLNGNAQERVETSIQHQKTRVKSTGKQ